jgi:hypothetical protein
MVHVQMGKQRWGEASEWASGDGGKHPMIKRRKQRCEKHENGQAAMVKNVEMGKRRW